MIRASLLEKILHVLVDFLASTACFYMAYWIQFRSGWIVDKYDPSRLFHNYREAGLIASVLWVGLFAFSGLYRKWLMESRLYQIIIVIRAVFYGMVLIYVAVFGMELVAKVFSPDSVSSEFLYQSRTKLILLYAMSLIVLVGMGRLLISEFLRKLLRKGFGADRILILGVNDAGRETLKKLQGAPELGQRVIGFMDERYAVMDNQEFEGLPIMGKYSDLSRVIREHRVTGLVISHESSSIHEILRVLDWVAEINLHIYIIPDLYDVVAGHFKGNLVHGVELQELFAFNMAPWQVRVKRLMDVSVAMLLLLITAPLLLLTAILIKLDSPGPIFYSQERVGLYGRKFMVYKFRSMRTDAEKAGPQWATKNDTRITRIGRLIRKTRIDEIPQLWCVLKGDMSMVGPRPEREHFIELLRKEIPLYMFRLKMKPGLTGWAQVRHSYDNSLEDVQKKLKYDLYYFENMSLLMDLQILVRTIYVVLTGKGAQ